jgi:nitroreductase
MDAIELLSTRSSHPKLAEPAPDDGTLRDILRDALRAPDHALLRPWRVLVVRGEGRERLGDVLADVEGGSDEARERARRKPLRAPLVLIVVATPRPHPKVPELEQVLSAGAVAHGILLGLSARGFAGMWRTGAAAYDARLAAALGLRAEDQVVGFVYAGTASAPAPAVERPRVDDHAVTWPENEPLA